MNPVSLRSVSEIFEGGEEGNEPGQESKVCTTGMGMTAAETEPTRKRVAKGALIERNFILQEAFEDEESNRIKSHILYRQESHSSFRRSLRVHQHNEKDIR